MPKPISKAQFLRMIQQFAAVEAVGTSAVRGQPAGTKKAIQNILARTDLNRMPRRSRAQFERWLDRQTIRIQRGLPSRAKPWGIARKTLNLFLRDCLYNHFLRTTYNFPAVEDWLEVALDGVVAGALKRSADRGALPRWLGLGHVTRDASDRFQAYAEDLADRLGLPARVYLDNYLWLANR